MPENDQYRLMSVMLLFVLDGELQGTSAALLCVYVCHKIENFKEVWAHFCKFLL